MVTAVKSKSLRQLARELGVSPAYLSQVKNGKKKPSAMVLTKMLTSVNHNEFDVRAYFGYNHTVAAQRYLHRQYVTLCDTQQLGVLL